MTFQLVTQCLNQLCHHVPYFYWTCLWKSREHNWTSDWLGNFYDVIVISLHVNNPRIIIPPFNRAWVPFILIYSRIAIVQSLNK
jgi:hypothetical protein